MRQQKRDQQERKAVNQKIKAWWIDFSFICKIQTIQQTLNKITHTKKKSFKKNEI